MSKLITTQNMLLAFVLISLCSIMVIAFEIKGFGGIHPGREKDKCTTLYNSDYMYFYAYASDNCSYWSASYSSSISETKKGKEVTKDFYWYFSLYMYSTCSGQEVYLYASNSSYDNPNWRDDPKTVIEYPDDDIYPRQTFFIRVCVIPNSNVEVDTSKCIPVEFEVTVNMQVSESNCKGWNLYQPPYPVENSPLCVVSQTYDSEGEGFSITNAFLRMAGTEYATTQGAAFTNPYVSLTKCGSCSGS